MKFIQHKINIILENYRAYCTVHTYSKSIGNKQEWS
jgi:hypothetical protein